MTDQINQLNQLSRTTCPPCPPCKTKTTKNLHRGNTALTSYYEKRDTGSYITIVDLCQKGLFEAINPVIYRDIDYRRTSEDNLRRSDLTKMDIDLIDSNTIGFYTRDDYSDPSVSAKVFFSLFNCREYITGFSSPKEISMKKLQDTPDRLGCNIINYY